MLQPSKCDNKYIESIGTILCGNLIRFFERRINQYWNNIHAIFFDFEI